ncbi:9730_t:CDS:2, partial [Ambispora leptoticha]
MVTSKKDKKLASVTMKLSENNEIIDGTPVDAREISNPAIIILGNTGSGKSTLSNWLFGFQGDDPNATFKTGWSMAPITKECQAGLIRINGKNYNLIEIPAVFNNMSMSDIRNDIVLRKISEIILVCSYGTQAILFVV